MSAPAPILEVRHANVRRGGEMILSDVSFALEEGGHTALIGPNGAGKSTLVNVLAKTVHPLAREDFRHVYKGRDRWSVADLRKEIGHVTQADPLLRGATYTVFEVVVSALYSAVGLDFHLTPSGEDRERAMEEIRKVGLERLAGKPLNTLSSGERAKALMARAAVNSPSVMLLDEAASGLDFPSRADFRSSVSAYANEGKTIVMVTHELSEVIPEIKRACLMKGGRIIAMGPKEEVFTEELLSEAYGKRVFVDKRGGLYSAWC